MNKPIEYCFSNRSNIFTSIIFTSSIIRHILSVLKKVISFSFKRKIGLQDQPYLIYCLRYGSVSFTLPNLLLGSFSALNTKFDLKKLNQFSKDHTNLGVAVVAFKEVLEKVSTNINWMDKNVPRIKTWFESKSRLII